MVRTPEVQATLDTARDIALDHAARERQAAQSLAMQALSEILNKRNEPDANPIEVRRAASALSRLASRRWDRPPHWDRPRSDRTSTRVNEEPDEPEDEADDEADEEERPVPRKVVHQGGRNPWVVQTLRPESS